MRARELGLYFGPLPTGKNNAITDVPGVTVGHISLIWGQGQLNPGQGPVRTGVTAILPHSGNLYTQKCPAAFYPYNGYGKSIGTIYVDELGICENPILITNTLSVAACLEGGLDWVLNHNPGVGIWERTPNILVFECDDSYLNDIRGRHVKPEHAVAAIANARGGPVQEGNVGAGVGMSSYDFKSGVGTSSRIVSTKLGTFTVGILMVSNFGERKDLIIKGVPIGLLMPYQPSHPEKNSNITVVATNAPLDARQLKRLAKRALLGLGKVGNICRHGCGNLVLAFSNAPWTNPKAPMEPVESGDNINPLFEAVVDASEEAMLNNLFQAETMIGANNRVREKVPIDKVLELLKQPRIFKN
ncbi:MAG TPA: P1 family peptidase [Verrucomicrobiae bacterium]|nr:P1 family peptidase [Verrucomicrobiae bacterium]